MSSEPEKPHHGIILPASRLAAASTSTTTAQPVSPQNATPPIPKQKSVLIDTLVGRNVEYYRKQWEVQEKNPRHIRVNGAAFVFGVMWLAYRRLYGLALAAFALILIVSASMLQATHKLVPSLLMPWLVISVFIAIFGNMLYIRKGMRRLDNLLATSVNDTDFYFRLSDMKATSRLSALLTLILMALFSYVANLGLNAMDMGFTGAQIFPAIKLHVLRDAAHLWSMILALVPAKHSTP